MCQWGDGVFPGMGGGRRKPLAKVAILLFYAALLTPEVASQSVNTTTSPPPTSTTRASTAFFTTSLPSTVGTTRKLRASTPSTWGSGVKITSLRVPHVVRNGSEGGATLDCEFWVSRDAEAGLVVKWFLNNGPAPVYQWIPGNGKEVGKPGYLGNGGGSPQGLGPLKGKLDLGFAQPQTDPQGVEGSAASPSGEPRVESSAEGEARKHQSALRIRKPTTDLSGDYKCSVSTFHDEDSMVKRMLVFAPEKSMVLSQSRAKVVTGDGMGDASTISYLNVTCYARGIYPEPKMALLWEPPSVMESEGSGDNSSEDDMSRMGEAAASKGGSFLEAGGGTASVETMWRPEAGVFDIRASESLPETTLASPTVFHCDLRIPEADYLVRRSLVYYPGNPDLSNGGTSIDPGSYSSCILMFICLCLALVNFSNIPLQLAL